MRDFRAYVQLHAYARMRQRSVEPFLSRLEEHHAMPPVGGGRSHGDRGRLVSQRSVVLAPIDLSPSRPDDAPALLSRLILAMGRLFSAWPTRRRARGDWRKAR
jgi:hypothetical protein